MVIVHLPVGWLAWQLLFYPVAITVRCMVGAAQRPTGSTDKAAAVAAAAAVAWQGVPLAGAVPGQWS